MIASDAPAKPTHNELIKEANPTLAGTIGRTLADPNTDRFSEDDAQFLKFHGIYQQDDRDLRKVAKKFIFMVRGRLPGGVVPPDLYLVFDRISRDHANNTLRITSRQGFQFHGIVKSGLGKLMKSINDALATTLAACGDVNRNVMAPPTPATSRLVERVQQDARRLSKALLPSTKAYHQIWVEGQELNLAGEEDREFVDPLYGKTYLPRKFKTAFVIPPLNDIDIFTNCLGFIAISEADTLLGYNLAAGGGLGMSHGNAQTFPRMADVIGFLRPEQIETAAKAVVTIHRDFGDRTNRKHARLKYVLADVPPDHHDAITAILAGHGIPVDNQATVVRRASMACPALPTCGLALAEAERLLPDLLTRIENLLAELGLKDEEIIIRITGCPNGCARPYMAEIGFVGKGPGRYQIYLGGNESSTRLNRVFKDTVKTEEITNVLRPVLARYAQERLGGERFGDFCARVIWKETETARN